MHLLENILLPAKAERFSGMCKKNGDIMKNKIIKIVNKHMFDASVWRYDIIVFCLVALFCRMVF